MNQTFRDRDRQRRNGNYSAVPRWAAIVGGSALAVYGLTRRSKTGAALATAGGLLAFGGTRISTEPQEIHTESSFTVNVSPEEAFRFWTNFENLPKFMSHLQSVRDLGNGRSEWVARGPMQMRIKWTAQIVDQRENQWIVWRSDADSVLPNTGSVQFRKAPGDRGTEITIVMQYQPPAGPIGKAVAMMFGKDPSQTIYEDLRHFKQLMEAGEIATTVGQPHGPRSLKIRMKQAIYDDYRPKPTQSERPQPQPQEVAS
ncbi:MAG TPA: SRPBCC family protein [Terriglobales bacterium]|nr:SRPBCC family protein [Terriglobales bacterium]